MSQDITVTISILFSIHNTTKQLRIYKILYHANNWGILAYKFIYLYSHNSFKIRLFLQQNRLAKDMETIKNALHAYIEDKDDMTSGDELERKEIPPNDSMENFLDFSPL